MKKTIVAAAVGAMALVSTGAMAATGEQVYNQACQVCHKMGVAGAPKLGDKAAWGPRIAQGMATLQDHAIKGFQGKTGVMPPKGGFMNLSDADVKAAVEYMTNNSK
ncbi:MAG: c-type cytochrome [Gammaproteobacteria bacterium]|nr:c-type cytochrome [Gammaproteobacteria bacterium]